MIRARFLVALVALAALLAPLADAQMRGAVSVSKPMPVPGGPGIPGPPEMVSVGIGLDGVSYGYGRPFLVAGFDNRLNASIYNGRDTWLNDTLVWSADRNATITPARVDVSIPPRSNGFALAAIHPDEVGLYQVTAALELNGAEGSGEGRSSSGFEATPPVSVRIVDPAPISGEDDEYESISGMRGMGVQIRTRPDGEIEFVLEVVNRGDGASPGFRLTLKAQGQAVADVDVPPLEPRETREIELEPWNPTSSIPDARYCRGCQFSFEFTGTFRVGGASFEFPLGAFEVRSGAIEGLAPAAGSVEVQESLVMDVLVPKKLRLGVPARVKVNVTNYGEDVVRGARLVVTLQTPNGLHYGVQGPEAREFQAQVAPGESRQYTFEFTPRVTGGWSVYTYVRTGQAGYGNGGGGFLVPSPVTIGVAWDGTPVVGRIGEPMPIEVAVATKEALENAELRIVAQPQNGGFSRDMYSGQAASLTRPGLAQGIVDATPEAVPLGTLRANDVLNASFTVRSSGSGVYTVSPFVLANGFAYTSGGEYNPHVGGSPTVSVAVNPRDVQLSWALFPFTLVVVVTVSAWTLRTRVVR